MGTGAYRVLWSNLRERDHLKDLGIDGRIMLKCNLIWVGERGFD